MRKLVDQPQQGQQMAIDPFFIVDMFTANIGNHNLKFEIYHDESTASDNCSPCTGIT